jgi:hypothetical protein
MSGHKKEDRMRKQFIILLTVLAVAGSVGAIAQMAPTLNVDIPFSFVAGTKTLPAGKYELQPSNNEMEMLIRSQNTGESVLVPLLTRLGPRSERDAEVVFDVAGSEHYLAEVHIPDIDGFAFKAAPGKHTHVSVKAKK